MSTKNYEEQVKLLMLGESGVGKSSIIQRFVDNKFTNNFITTLGVEYKQKVKNIRNKECLIQIWDTAGQEKFRTITPIYYKKVDGVVMVFDLQDQNSFDSVEYWMQNLHDHADPNIKVILVANKSDLEAKRVINEEDAKKQAEKYEMPYLEASAKTKVNITEIFDTITEEILESRAEGKGVKMVESSKLSRKGSETKSSDPENTKKKCC